MTTSSNAGWGLHLDRRQPRAMATGGHVRESGKALVASAKKASTRCRRRSGHDALDEGRGSVISDRRSSLRRSSPRSSGTTSSSTGPPRRGFSASCSSTSDPYVGTILAFSRLRRFVARPLGATLFAFRGSEIRRKALLVTTNGHGLRDHCGRVVPSYDSSAWSAVLLTLARALQGLAVGGEWSGSVLIAGEWAAPKRRGLVTSFAQRARRSD